MTKEEREKAIERLKHIKIHGANIPNESIDIQRRDIEALDMAIESLEQESNTDVLEQIKEKMMHYHDGFVMFGRNDIAYAVDNCIKMLDKAISEVEE